MQKGIALLVVAGAIGFALSGCRTQSRIYFAQPATARVFLDNRAEPVVMPAMLDLPQTDPAGNVGTDEGGQPLRLVLPDGTKLKGLLYVYWGQPDQAEEPARVEFGLAEEEIAKLKAGQTVTVIGSSSKAQPIYKVTLGADKK